LNRTVIAGFALWALVRLAGLDLVTPLVQLISYTPYVAAASVLPLVVSLALRRWREAAVALLVVAAFGFAVVPRAVGGPGERGTPLVVLSVNVLGGGGDTTRIMDLIRRERPDVVSVQELTDEVVARLDTAGIATFLPHRALRPQPGVSGTGLYGKYPLAAPRGLHPESTFDMARAALRMPGREIDVVAVHTSPPLPGGPVTRWQRDFDLLPRPGSPIRILAGDFNATLDHRELRNLLGDGYRDAAASVGAGLVPTWPHGGPLPPVTLDHVLLDERVGVRSVEVFDLPGSDHRAVVARLTV
jgi:endonuclease/exonuclease/phosphatase (EEP) superfamily protein YafD